ncbi:flagellar biosynthesis protein FlgC [Dyella solisilvae]|uniref:Flagellar biosynthesis protein FlgC n=1 Tax=Dyella solisilvae TaxID=1920168 RepID=A0A370KBA0_9GAMM|nr:flagellar basal body rod C-terminal domain-containing protein [Dyella solisilvae]RDI99320.1 flagellar biosynthesis protein FlgC [Dyella solisilvae]
MVVDAIFNATRFGLQYERLRLEAASHNIAVANTASTTGHGAQLLHAVSGRAMSFDAMAGLSHRGAGDAPTLVAEDAAERKVHDPSDPLADASGMVSYPKVDLVQEMSTLVDAGRAYEANVRAFNTLRAMELHALDVGGGS